MIDFSLMKVGDSVVLPIRGWIDDNKAIYAEAGEYARVSGTQFECNFKRVGATVKTPEYTEVSIKRIK